MKSLVKKSGAALLTVLIAMMIISIMLFEFQYETMVERKLAYNELDQLRAYYLAKSGVRIGLLRVALYGRARRSKELKDATKSIAANINPFLDMIWNLPLPPFPPDKAMLTKMDKSDRDAAEKTIQETKVSDGKFSQVITSEASKINLNFLIIPSNLQNERISFTSSAQPQGLFQSVGAMFLTLLENLFRESDNPNEEYGIVKPEELVFDIIDWINPGNTRANGGNKDAFYEQQKPPYKAKRNRFYTLEELKLVKGMSDHLFEKIRPYITVYSYDGKININTATSTMYRALSRDLSEDDVKRLLEERDKRGGWASEGEFVDYVSATLGRGSFKTAYPDANNYPFTTSSYSFLIESMGSISKSKSQVQKIIRVGVALTQGKGGQVDSTITNPNLCLPAQGRFWDPRDNRCKVMPRSKSDCDNLGSSGWQQNPQKNGQYCCYIVNGIVPPLCPDITPGSVAAEPNALKILYWAES